MTAMFRPDSNGTLNSGVVNSMSSRNATML